eukprot:TRINITY_DN50326_c0_g1_i1.p1 TRINITY_DN50326_c0_g1~~TRINITY_DN50326_c0_g1_i1.p1  ORF type:complete len:269 (+),score=73.94 TRINITY_DN50326_c0_g1_i1:39-845(+)
MPAALKADASLVQASKYAEGYQNAVQRAMNPGGRGWVSISRIRGPAYDKHEHCLEQARKVTDHQVGVFLMMEVIGSICDGGIMAECGFPCQDVYSVLQKRLQGLAQDVQEGRRDKAATKTWVQKECFDDLAEMRYVTGPSGSNFAAEDLGDWTLLQTQFLEEVDKKLSASEEKAAKERIASEKVAAAQAALEVSKKESQDARKKLNTCEAKEQKATLELEKCQKELDKLKQPAESSLSSASFDNADANSVPVIKRPAANVGNKRRKVN